jgi:hypothetical protein
MGATGRYTDKPTKEVIADELNWENGGSGGRVVEIAMKPGVAYVAWERWYAATATEPEKRFVIGVVVLHSRGDGEVITRVNTEDMGPHEVDCPASILALLSPVEAFAEPSTPGNEGGYEWATRWRKDCRDNLAKRAIAPSKDGAKIRFKEPIKFTDGQRAGTFRLYKRGRTIRFGIIALDGTEDRWQRYTISNWKTREYEVVQ